MKERAKMGDEAIRGENTPAGAVQCSAVQCNAVHCSAELITVGGNGGVILK
jgi:hypothetical protein